MFERLLEGMSGEDIIRLFIENLAFLKKFVKDSLKEIL